MVKFIGGTIGAIFMIGLVVVVGLLMLTFLAWESGFKRRL